MGEVQRRWNQRHIAKITNSFTPGCLDCQYIKRESKKQARREKDELRRSLGLVKGKDSMGRTLWE